MNGYSAYGGKVLGTTALVKHAVVVAKLGRDAVIFTGHQAAADENEATSLVLVPIAARPSKFPQSPRSPLLNLVARLRKC